MEGLYDPLFFRRKFSYMLVDSKYESGELRSIFPLVSMAIPFGVFVCSLVFKPSFPDSWYDYQRVFGLVLLTISSFIIPIIPAQRSSGVRAVLAVSVAIGCLYAVVHFQHFRPVLTEVLTVALFIASVCCWSVFLTASQRALFFFMAGLQLSIVFYIICRFLWYVASISNDLLPDPFSFFDGFVNPRFFGAWVTLSWPLFLINCSTGYDLSSRGRRLIWPGLRVFFAGIWLALAIFSGSRATWLAIISVLFVTFACGAAGRRIAIRGATAVIIGLMLHELLFVLIPEWQTGKTVVNSLDRLRSGLSLSGREILWRIALEGIAERPWFGAGPMMFSATNNGVASTTHNVFLQLAYEWGLPFAVIAMVLVLRWLWFQFMICREKQDRCRIVLWMCVVGGMIEAQFDGLLSAPYSQLSTAFIVALILSLDRRAQNNTGPLTVVMWSLLRFSPLVMSITLWWVIWPELSNLESWEAQTLQQTSVEHFQPRFWLQGVVFPDK